MEKNNILCLSPLPEMVLKGLFSMKVASEEAERLTFITLRREANREELIEAVSNADCILGDYKMKITLDAEALKAASRCILIQQPSVGYQHIDVRGAQAEGIPVANAAGANAESVAEHTIMVALACLKKLLLSHQKTKAGQWAQDEMANYGVFELMGKTFGILGMGRIGRQVAARAKVFGCNLIYYDARRLSDEEEAELSVEYRPLDELLADSDVISIHTPLTEETENLLNERLIAGIKQNAILINVARGGVVDEAAVARALEDGRMGGAAFDVFTTEPISPDNPLLEAPNTILTPHLAGATNESRMRIIDFAIGNIAKALAGQRPDSLVNEVAWPRYIS
jgi:phosphoglycerate dehydrogenase-like enzyme